MASLCVNIDHIATLRQARRGTEPDPVLAVGVVERAGSTGITVHLREDQRHIQHRDVRLIREVTQGHLNLEMAATPAMVEQALALRPQIATLVPERREEITTEGGLDVAGLFESVRQATARLQDAGIEVSLFIDPDPEAIAASVRAGARQIELHTGQYSNAHPGAQQQAELMRLVRASALAVEAGLVLNAGHGLNYRNVLPVAAIPGMRELNIGHSIIGRAVFSGLAEAVAEMVRLIEQATHHPGVYLDPDLF